MIEGERGKESVSILSGCCWLLRRGVYSPSIPIQYIPGTSHPSYALLDLSV
jgi:hypothetical protein